MPFDAAEVARQIEQSRGGVRANERAREDAITLALKIYRSTAETDWEQRVQDAAARRWVGLPLSPLRDKPLAKPSGLDYSVTATDSSFVAPDKHRGSFSHLLTVGRVMVTHDYQPAAE